MLQYLFLCKKTFFCIKKENIATTILEQLFRNNKERYSFNMKHRLSKQFITILIFLSLIISPLLSGRAEEFKFMKEEMEKSHKNFFNTISKEECEKVYERLSSGIDDISYTDYYFTLSSYLALSNDSHTSLEANDIYSYFLYYPLQLNYIGDKVYVVSGLKDYRDCIGKEITAINGVSIKEIEEKASLVVPHDNTVYLRLWLNNQLNNTSFLSFINVAESDKDPVTLTFSDGKKLSISPTLSQDIDRSNLISAFSSYSPYIYQGYYRAIEIKDDVLLISYNTCSDNPSYPMKNFTSDLKKAPSKKKYSKIIVDLRYNGGGNSAVLESLIKLLKKEKCEKYALIGENTFSSAILNAVSLKDDANFTLVGTPTGGSINHYGELKSFTLPDTGWEVYYSSKFFKLSNKYDGSIIPDVIIEKDAESYFSGIDNEIEYCLNNK